MARRSLALALFSLSVASCSDSKLVDMNGDGIDDSIVAPNNVTVVTPTKPMGFVAGQVTNGLTNDPLAGATVSLFGGGVGGMATTDNAGFFQFGPIAAGASFAVRVTADGFADATISNVTVDDAAGNFPTSNGALYVGPVGLIPLNGMFTVQVVSSNGAPVMNAAVTVETMVRFFLGDQPRSSAVSSATSDADGLAKLSGMIDVRSFPPNRVNQAGLVVNVAPIDMNNDGLADLRGATVAIPGADVIRGGAPPLIVLEPPASRALEVVASNVAGLVRATTAPSLLASSENIRVVFNVPIDRDSVLIDLRDETGATTIPAPFVVGVVGNVLSIDPSSDFEQGKEYNVSVRASGQGTPEVFSGAAPFFAEVDPNVAIGTIGRFRDLNGNQAWGDGNDQIELIVSIPIGRPSAAPAFRVKAWFALDFNGSGVLGDTQGELPPSGAAYPSPFVLAAAEPVVPNGARASGYTRYVQALPINLPAPLGMAAGGAAFEVRIDPEDNDGAFVTDASGRLAPSRTTGTALLQ